MVQCGEAFVPWVWWASRQARQAAHGTRVLWQERHQRWRSCSTQPTRGEAGIG